MNGVSFPAILKEISTFETVKPSELDYHEKTTAGHVVTINNADFFLCTILS